MPNPMQSQTDQQLHLAIIMDGNGRWANRQGKPRMVGHQMGASRVREIVEAAPELGIQILTLFAFSSDNWQRPKFEVNFLMNLLKSYLESEVIKCQENGIKLTIIGRRDRLNTQLLHLIEKTERLTASGTNLQLRVAIDYSSRDAIVQAARMISKNDTVSRESFANLLSSNGNPWEYSPEVDILIRTGGEKRLSDFLLWECAYAELFFLPVMWPDFTVKNLKDTIQEFHLRERRFGQIPALVSNQ
jgi:undecaprenyl diphosphate synthase